MSGAKTVVALIDKDGAYIDALNPLPIAGGGVALLLRAQVGNETVNIRGWLGS